MKQIIKVNLPLLKAFLLFIPLLNSCATTPPPKLLYPEVILIDPTSVDLNDPNLKIVIPPMAPRAPTPRQ